MCMCVYYSTFRSRCQEEKSDYSLFSLKICFVPRETIFFVCRTDKSNSSASGSKQIPSISLRFNSRLFRSWWIFSSIKAAITELSGITPHPFNPRYSSHHAVSVAQPLRDYSCGSSVSVPFVLSSGFLFALSIDDSPKI